MREKGKVSHQWIMFQSVLEGAKGLLRGKAHA
jgi:hypothetical protein